MKQELNDFDKKLDSISIEKFKRTEPISPYFLLCFIGFFSENIEKNCLMSFLNKILGDDSEVHSQARLFGTWWFWCKGWPAQADYDWKWLKRSDWRIVSLEIWETEPAEDENSSATLNMFSNLL